MEKMPSGSARKLKPVRIGLYDQYGGSAPSGWTRFLLEQFEFPHEVVYPQTLDAGNLRAKFDVLLFPTKPIAALAAMTIHAPKPSPRSSALCWAASPTIRPCRNSRPLSEPAARC